MKRLASIVVVAAALAAAASSSAAAAGTLHATFHVIFAKGHPVSNAPCPSDAFCGVGAVAGYGGATITILDEQFEDLGNGCFAVTRIEEISLIDQSGTLMLDEQGSFCRPGGSGDSHAGPSSYGHPGRFTFRYEITRATGAFTGASGSGTATMNVAGAAAVWHVGN